MHPILIKIGSITIHTYGFLIAVGFIIAVNLVKKLAAEAKLDVERILDLCFWSLMIGFVGARTLFVITRLQYFLQDPLAIFKVWEGGLVFLGGPLVVIPFLVWYTRKNKIPVWKTLDVLTPALVINHVFGRFGCLSAGCCYGKPTGTEFGIRFYSDLVERHLQGIPLHPTQLYEAGALLILFVGLLVINKKKVFDGQVALSYLLAYPVIRSLIEVFRGDLIRGFVIDDWVSTSQFLSSLVFVGASITLAMRLKAVQKVKLRA